MFVLLLVLVALGVAVLALLAMPRRLAAPLLVVLGTLLVSIAGVVFAAGGADLVAVLVALVVGVLLTVGGLWWGDALTREFWVAPASMGLDRVDVELDRNADEVAR